MKTVPAFTVAHGLLRKSLPLWVLAASLNFSHVDSVQAQGYYYPVTTPATTTTGPVYNEQPYAGISDYGLLDSAVRNVAANLPTPQLMSIYVPTPPGYTPPTAAVFEAAVNQATTAVLNNAAPNVTLQSLVVAAVQYLPGDRGNIGLQIGKAIATQYAADATGATTQLTTVVNALASAQPGLVVATVQGMLGTDSTGKSPLGTAVFNDGAASHVIATVVATTISAIPSDATGVASVVASGVTAIATGNLTAAQRGTIYIDPTVGYVEQLLTSSAAQNNQTNVDLIVKGVMASNGISLVPPIGTNPPVSSPNSSIGQILAAAVTGLQFYSSPTPAQDVTNQYNLIALTDGALASAQGGTNAAAVGTLLAGFAKVSAYSSYSGATVGGFTNGTTAAAFTAYVGGVSNFAAAAASGAVTRNGSLIASFVQSALTVAPSTATRDVVFASVLASPGGVGSAIVGAINPNGGGAGIPAVYGGGTFGDVAWGAYQAGPTSAAGTSIGTLLSHIGTYVASSNPGFAAQLAKATDVINGAVSGADAGGKSGLIADLIFSAANSGRGMPVGYSGPLAAAAVTAITNTPDLGAANNYIAVVAALAGDAGTSRAAIQNATYLGSGIMTTTPGSDITAATNGANVVFDLQTNSANKFGLTLARLDNASSLPATGTAPGSRQNSVLASLYGAVLANNGETDAALAAAIKLTDIDPNLLTTTAINADAAFNGNATQVLLEVGKIAALAKANSVNPALKQLFGYVGTEIISYPSLVNDIVTAWTVVDPDHAHYVATVTAFVSPASASTTVASLFRYAQITSAAPYGQPTVNNSGGATALSLTGTTVTVASVAGLNPGDTITGAGIPAGTKISSISGNVLTLNTPVAVANGTTLTDGATITSASATTGKPFPGTRGPIIDQPAAAGAITAGYVTGILESDPTFRFGVATSAISAATKTNLQNVVVSAVIASVTEAGVALQGPASPFNATNAQSAGYASYFRQSDGASTTSFYTSGANTRTVGAAGAVTGFVAQLTYQGDTTISPITAAVLAYAGNSAKTYGLQIAQAAAQAFAWVSAGPTANSQFTAFDLPATPTTVEVGNPVYDIAKALISVVTGVTMAQLENAAYFGITEANKGTIGAGALGLNATGLTDGTLQVAPAGNAKANFYQHASATGTPVTNIFNL